MTLLPEWRPALARLGAALAREVLRLRARYQLSLDEFRGLYISDEQVDALLAGAGALPADTAGLPVLEPGHLFAGVIERFGLSATAADVLLLALAPDIDPKYASILAYVNDDVQRRWPTVDLTRRLLGISDTLAAALDPAGPLFGPGVLLPAGAAEWRGALSLTEFAANPVVSAYLLGAAVRLPSGLAWLLSWLPERGRSSY